MLEPHVESGGESPVSLIVAIGIASALALSPLAWWPQDPYGLVKNLLVEWTAFILGAVWLCAALARGELRWKRSPVTVPLAVLIAWACVSFFLSPFRGYGSPRLRELLSALFLYLLALNLCGRERERRIVFAGALAGLGAASLTGLAQFLQMLPTRWETSPWGSGLGPRVYGTMLNPNILAGQIIALFPLGLSLFLLLWRGPRRALGGVTLVLAFSCLLLTVSWGGYAGFVAGTALVLAVFARRGLRERAFSGKAPLRLAIVTAALAVLFFSTQGKNTVADMSGMRARVLIWRASAAATGEKPVFGHGPGNTPSALGAHLTRAIMRERRENPGSSPWRGSYRVRFLDGDYFGQAVEFGLVGLGLFAWFFATVLRDVARSLRRDQSDGAVCALLGLAGCAAALLVQSAVSYPLRVPPTAAVFLVLLGIGASAGSRGAARYDLRRITRAGKAALYIIVALFFALLCLHSAATLRGETLLVRAYHCARLGRWAEAAKWSTAAVRYPVTDPEAYNIRGDALLHLGRPEDSEKAFVRLLLFDPSRPDTHDKLGMIYEGRGDDGLALEYYRRAVALERHDTPRFRLHLARLLERRGSLDEALRILHEGLTVYPDNAALRAEIARLRGAKS